MIREARRRQQFSQTRLAAIAGISRRQLASIESGANTSVRVLHRLAEVLRLEQIAIGSSTMFTTNVAGLDPRLLLDRTAAAANSIREAGVALQEVTTAISLEGVHVQDRIADRPVEDASVDGQIDVPLLAELRPGSPLHFSAIVELVRLPRSEIQAGEAVIRFRGKTLAREGIADRDLLIVEMRPSGNAATGELVIAIIAGSADIGRWWNKNSIRALRGRRTDTVSRRIGAHEPVLIFAAVTAIVRRGVPQST